MNAKVDTELLQKMGFKRASSELARKQELKRKMMIAYENFKFVTPKIFNRFQIALRKQSEVIKQGDGSWKKGKIDPRRYQDVKYDKLVFKKVSEFDACPPQEALEEMNRAVEMGCFDEFEVAKIEAVTERKDPIIFGIIRGCPDKFFITQWDNDVKIEDILQGMEG
jgi:hypothetical protein